MPPSQLVLVLGPLLVMLVLVPSECRPEKTARRPVVATTRPGDSCRGPRVAQGLVEVFEEVEPARALNITVVVVVVVIVAVLGGDAT